MIGYIITNCFDIILAEKNDGVYNFWRSSYKIAEFHYLPCHVSAEVEQISRQSNVITNGLVTKGRTSHDLTLYHKGMDLPR